MTIQQVVDAILAYHPQIDRPETCDGFKCGNPLDECKGIVTTCMASVDVIRKTAELGYNLIVCHEPTFYTHMDRTSWLEGNNEVYDEKRRLIDKHGIAIWRDHDHIHAHKPDGIFLGVMKELGWEEFLVDDPDRPRLFKLPKTTVRKLAGFLRKKMELNGVRVIGSIDAEVSTVAFGGHAYPTVPEQNATNLLNTVDVLIPGELIDWTVTSYARDAAQLGKHKAILHVGHFSMEELGMKYAVNWIKELIDPDIPVQFVRSGDPYNYLF
jgi:putative NIF3 family GTP cyclohydrolase 1 type 2